MTPRDASTLGRVRDESGFVLIEAVVSAALLIMVVLAVFTTLDQGSRLSGVQVRRAMAANMAQAELERVRSLPIEDIANLKGRRKVIPDPARPEDYYWITTQSKWLTDGSDEPDCTTRSGGLDYMRVSTLVTWSEQARTSAPKAKPIVLSTLVTPTSRSASTTAGSLSVNINRADGTTGASGITVTITPQAAGGQSFTETTNTNGCVVFPFVPAGNYDLTFKRAGWVTQNSVEDVKETVKVTAGATTKVEYLFDLGGTTSMNFRTVLADGREIATSPESVALYNGDQVNGPLVVDLGGAVSNWFSGRLFPSKTPYTLYAGACKLNAPNANVTSVNIPAGNPQPAGNVRVPAYDIRVFSGSSAASPGARVSGAKVTFYPGCGDTYSGVTNSDGRLDDPGFPYTNATAPGTLCVSRGGRRYLAANIANNDMDDSVPYRDIYLTKTGDPQYTSTSTECVA